jgi:hypothetical protein
MCGWLKNQVDDDTTMLKAVNQIPLGSVTCWCSNITFNLIPDLNQHYPKIGPNSLRSWTAPLLRWSVLIFEFPAVHSFQLSLCYNFQVSFSLSAFLSSSLDVSMSKLHMRVLCSTAMSICPNESLHDSICEFYVQPRCLYVQFQTRACMALSGSICLGVLILTFHLPSLIEASNVKLRPCLTVLDLFKITDPNSGEMLKKKSQPLTFGIFFSTFHQNFFQLFCLAWITDPGHKILCS